MSGRFRKRKKIRLLVVDNQTAHFDLIKGYADVVEDDIELKCNFAASGKEAIDLMKSWDPSVVLLDVYMPDINGFDILERCNLGQTPIVITCRSESADLREAALNRGACGFIEKSNNPDDIEQLLYMLADLVEYSEATRH